MREWKSWLINKEWFAIYDDEELVQATFRNDPAMKAIYIYMIPRW